MRNTVASARSACYWRRPRVGHLGVQPSARTGGTWAWSAPGLPVHPAIASIGRRVSSSVLVIVAGTGPDREGPRRARAAAAAASAPGGGTAVKPDPVMISIRPGGDGEIREGHVELANSHVHFYVHGASEGLPLLLLHHREKGNLHWQEAMQRYANMGHYVVAIDPPGDGGSPALHAKASLTTAKAVFGPSVSKFDVIGQHMGAVAAIQVIRNSNYINYIGWAPL